MKNIFNRGIYPIALVTFAILTSANASAEDASQSARDAAKRDCLVQNKIQDSAAQKMTCSQLLTMDQCMRGKGFRVGKRESCKDQ
jgi:hypothetical protein